MTKRISPLRQRRVGQSKTPPWFAEVPSPEAKPDPLQSRTIADLRCPHCGHVDTYAPALMTRRPGPEKE
jgi:hypothetical protein